MSLDHTHVGVRNGRGKLNRQRALALGSLIAAAVAVLTLVLTSVPGSGGSSVATSLASATGSSGSAGAGPPAGAAVPILVYHVINSAPSSSSADPHLYVPVAQFTSQMQALKAAGWHAVTLDQLEAAWAKGASLGRGKPIVITFDNGYASQYINALPVLRQLGWVAVEDLQLSGMSASDGGLTDTQIRGLVSAGWELDTQGMTHADLYGAGSGQLSSEVTTARTTLRSQYGVPANWFAYPSGDYDSNTVAAVRAAGFTGATTVNPGLAGPHTNRYLLPRLPVLPDTSSSALLSQISAVKTNTATPSSYSNLGLA